METLQTGIADKAETFDHMLEVARAAGFESITEAIVVAKKAREAAQEPALWQVRRMNNPPGPWKLAIEPQYAKHVYEKCPNHTDVDGWQYRPLYPHPPAAQSAGQELVDSLRDNLKRAIDAFDDAAQNWGWQADQGYGESVDKARNAYNGAKADLEYLVMELGQAAPVNGGEREHVATVKGGDEYGPILEWRKPWPQLIGKRLFVGDDHE